MALHDDNTLPPLSPRIAGRFLAIYLPILVLLGGVVSILHHQESRNELTLQSRDALHIVELQHSILSRQFESIESDLLFLAEEGHLHDYLSGRVETPRAVARHYALFSREKGIFDQIRYLDEEGREVVRVNSLQGEAIVVDDDDLQSKAHRYYFAEARALQHGEVFVSAFDLNVEHGQIERPLTPTVRFATPVFGPSGNGRGVLVLNYRGKKVIDELSKAGANSPGDLLLVNLDGSWIQGPRAGGDWELLAEDGHRFGTLYPEAWASISEAHEGQFVDSGDLFTFEAVCHPSKSRPPSTGTPRSPVEKGPCSGIGARPVLTIVSHVPADAFRALSKRSLNSLLLPYALGALPLAVGVWLMARTRAQHQLGEERLRESEARLRALSLRLATAQEDDRRRISRDLHDDLGQQVTALILDLQRSLRALKGGRAREMVTTALQSAEGLLQRVRDISSELRPRILDDLGLEDAVESLLAELTTQAGLEIRSALVFAHHDLPSTVSENIYRILQESLTNVCKHARVSEATVTLRVSEQRVTLTVSDEGAGFRPASVGDDALGIRGMRERVELLNGTLDVESEPGVGTVIHASIPMVERDDKARPQQGRE